MNLVARPDDDETPSGTGSGSVRGPRAGERLGGYRLLKVIGRGGMGVVYKARHNRLNKIVALKVLSDLRMKQPGMLERFQREMKAAGQVEHPHIVRALDADEVQGVHFLVMEYVDGLDLSALLNRCGPFSVAAACELICMAASGLECIHRAGMVHRDLKPGNLMLSRDRQLKILDLGMALLQPQHNLSTPQLTSVDQMMGTVDFMAPEQAGHTHDVDSQADVYGLGATFFALLTGRSRFGDQPLTLMQKLSILANEQPPSVHQFRDDVPESVAELIVRMLDRNPQCRPASVRDVVESLRPFADASALTELPLDSDEAPISALDTAATFQRSVYLEQETEVIIDGSSHSGLSDSDPEVNSSAPGMSVGRRMLALVVCAFVGAIVLVVWMYRSRDNTRPGASTALFQGSAETAVASDVSELTEPMPLEPELAVAELTEEPADVLMESASGETEVVRAFPEDSASLLRAFASHADPDHRANVIHRAVEYLQPEVLLSHLVSTNESSIRAGLLLALSEYDQTQVLTAWLLLNSESDGLIEMLLHWYVNDPDAEVHACLEYLLRRWGQQSKLQQLRPILEQKVLTADTEWYQPLCVSAMVVIPGPRTERIGSELNEPDRFVDPLQNEDVRTVTIPYTFAVCCTEVTREQFWRLSRGFGETPAPLNPHDPIQDVYWYHAAEICNRLSELEGIPAEQHCYLRAKTEKGVHWRQKPDAVELSGYRLPTDAEWEIACRAGTRTIRPHGNDTIWNSKYIAAQQETPLPLPVGSLKPNSWGLFDMLGNVSEWIHSEKRPAAEESGIRRIRGGSVWTEISGLRSAARYHYPDDLRSPKFGFRVARTIHAGSKQLSDNQQEIAAVELQAGPAAGPPELSRYNEGNFRAIDDHHSVSFGAWQIRDAPLRRFRLLNQLNRPISIAQLPIMCPLFAYDPEPPLQIAAKSSVEFGIRMLPLRQMGQRSQSVRFQFTDTEGGDNGIVAAPVDLQIHGSVEGPWLEVFNIGRFGQQPAHSTMGVVPRGSRLGSTYFLRNIGSHSLEADVVSVSAPFELTDTPDGPIVPHRLEKYLRIQLKSDIAGAVHGEVVLRTREAEPFEFRFPVSAIVSESRVFSSIGVFRDGLWLIDHNRDGVPDEVIEFGSPGDQPLTGDWNGDGIHDIGVWSSGIDGTVTVRLQLRGQQPLPQLERSEFQIPVADCQVVAADRDGDGRTEIGYVVADRITDELIWRFDQHQDLTFAEQCVLGRPGDDPVIGDWNGDGIDDLAVSRSALSSNSGARVWKLKLLGHSVPHDLIYLSPGDVPIAGDWDGDGADDPGGWRPVAEPNDSFWQFETTGDSHSNSDLYGFGKPGDIPIVLRQRIRSISVDGATGEQ